MARKVFLYHPGPCPLPIPRCGEPPERALLLASDLTPAVSPPASLPDTRRTSQHRLRHFLAEKDRTRHSNPSSIMPSIPRKAFFSGLSDGAFAPRSRSSYTITSGAPTGRSILVSYVVAP